MKERLILQHTLGITTTNSTVVVYDSLLIYQAGASLVIYNYIEDKSRFIQLGSKQISCLDNHKNYLALGEFGHQPKILIYDLNTDRLERSISGHKYGVLMAKFTPNGNYLITIGHHNDKYIMVWDWKSGRKIGNVKIATKVLGLAVDQNSKYFVTIGSKHIKYWDLSKLNNNTLMNSQIIEGYAGLLGEHRDLILCDVSCSIGIGDNGRASCFTYAISSNGLVLMLNETFVMEKWLDARMEKGSCILATNSFIICAGSDGKIRLFEPISLKHLKNLPLPDPISLAIQGDSYSFPQIFSMQITIDLKLFVVYSNRTIIIYDLHNIDNIIVTKRFYQHSDCIWGSCAFKNTFSTSDFRYGFATFSTDGSIKIWNSDSLSSSNQAPTLYCTLEVDSEDMNKYKDLTRFEPLLDLNSRTGIRSVTIEPEMGILAAGDRHGTINIYSMTNFEYLFQIEAHDAEIMALDFAYFNAKEIFLLASASRDRLIHIFDATRFIQHRQFVLLQTLEDHSSTVTAIKFADGGSKLISCGADKSVVFRTVQNVIAELIKEESLSFLPYRITPMKSTIFDMAIANESRKVFTVSQDKRITIFDLDTGKIVTSFTPNIPVNDSSTKMNPFMNAIVTEPNGKILCTSSSDKIIHLIDAKNGSSVFQGHGHGDIVTGITLINEGSHLVSTSTDGCIFIWKISDIFRKKIGSSSTKVQVQSELVTSMNSNEKISPVNVFKYNEDGLPSWARTYSTDDLKSPEIPIALGKWAERVDHEGVVLYSDISDLDRPVAKMEKRRRYSNEEATSSKTISVHARYNTSPLPTSVPSKFKSNENLNSPVHVVRVISKINFHDDNTPGPFAGEIESDPEEEEPEDRVFNHGSFQITNDVKRDNRNSLTFNHYTKKKFNRNENSPLLDLSSPSIHVGSPPNDIVNEPETPMDMNMQKTRQKIESLKGQLEQMEISVKMPSEVEGVSKFGGLSLDELKLFESLAERTAKAVVELGDKKARESLINVNKITTTALVRGDWTRELLERYSDQLVAIVKQKISE